MADVNDFQDWANRKGADDLSNTGPGLSEDLEPAADEAPDEEMAGDPAEVLATASTTLSDVADTLDGIVDQLEDPQGVQGVIDQLRSGVETLTAESDEFAGGGEDDESGEEAGAEAPMTDEIPDEGAPV